MSAMPVFHLVLLYVSICVGLALVVEYYVARRFKLPD